MSNKITLAKNPLTLAIFSALMLSTGQVNAQNTLEEVIVTAQKREQSLSDVGIAISVLSTEMIRDLDITSTQDVALYTPGFTVTDSGASGIPVYTIRGVGFDDFSSNSSSTVGIYQDEVNLPYPLMTRAISFDQQRIEVLKGPQGDLYGRNSTGGTVNFVSNKPTAENESRLVLGYGTYQTSQAEGFINGTLGESVNARLSFGYENRGEGWQFNELTGEKNGKFKNYGARLLVDWSASDSVDVLFNLHGGRDRGEPLQIQSTLILPAANDAAAYLYSIGYFPVDSLDSFLVQDQSNPKAARWNVRPDWDGKSEGASVTVNWDIDSITLTSITAYDKYQRDTQADWDGMPIKSLDQASQTEIKAWSQELRLSSDNSGSINWIGGLYFSGDEVTDNSQYDASESPTIGFTFGSIAKQETSTQAAFGHIEWEISEKFSLVLGGRYTKEERKIENCTLDTGDGSAAYTLGVLFPYFGYYILDGNPAAAGECTHLRGIGTDPVSGLEIVEVAGLNSNKINTNKFTGKVGLNYYPNDNWLMYASLSNGFKSGGYNTYSALLEFQFDPYLDEELTSVEFGFKGDLLDNSMRMSGAVFSYDYKDKQISDVIPDPLGIFPGLAGLRNIKKSSIKGAELEIQWLPLDSLTFMAATTYLDSEVKKDNVAFDYFTGGFFNSEGFTLPNTPKWSHMLMGSWNAQVSDSLAMRITVDWVYQGETKSLLSDNPVWKVPSYNLLGARLALESVEGTWSIALWGKNLSNEKYFFANSVAQDNIGRYMGLPRTYGITFAYNWF